MIKGQIQPTATIIEALKQMDSEHVKVLIVMENDHFTGLITIGDIQRAILRNIQTNACIKQILDKNKQYASLHDSDELIKKKMISLRAEIMPVIDDKGNLIKVYSWNDFFNEDNNLISSSSLNLPVVIMAGGKGTRLKPLTNIYPKPLIPIGEKTIIESIMDRFVSYNCLDFYISVNYKADVIKNYFDFLNNPQYHISYFQEAKPMGTAGSLRLLKDKLHSTFFVSNCDILINENYGDILKYHQENSNELTVVAALKTYSIPYGTIITKENGLLESIEEKPNLSFKINTGLYILEPSVLEDIPNKFFHITHLMEKLQKDGRRVGVYPISQNDWIDMGDWDEYLKLIRK
ncbi:nucleotidyltransferase family protein [Phocaeicola plebeius]|uniref:nucleotidyltransferase family protein n=1 Tax=Phocaeicola plebeius TaxID=310297 RepID=UPI00266D76E6|nr:nucleotidyltransferase family protein [Phocaeicola plebeius]